MDVVKLMTKTKFVVKLNRVGTHAAEYVRRIDRSPIQTTTNRKQALIMGRFTAEDAVKSLQHTRCKPELVSVEVRL
jgi:RIO-like serine/threonine protein kinase